MRVSFQFWSINALRIYSFWMRQLLSQFYISFTWDNKNMPFIAVCRKCEYLMLGRRSMALLQNTLALFTMRNLPSPQLTFPHMSPPPSHLFVPELSEVLSTTALSHLLSQSQPFRALLQASQTGVHRSLCNLRC